MYVGVTLLGLAVALCAHSVCVCEFGGMLPQENLGHLDIPRAFLVHLGGGGEGGVKTRQLNIWMAREWNHSVYDVINLELDCKTLPTLND